jgi:adenylate kinase
MTPLNVVMLGPPGAGKGTQAERIARARGIPKISTGDILREAVHMMTELGLRAKAIMDRGELVGDEVMIGIVGDRLDRADTISGFVLDGFPRTVDQAVALDSMIRGRGPLVVIDLRVPESELVRRLGSRLICEECGATAGIFDAGGAPDRPVVPAVAPIGAAETTAAARAVTEPMRCRRCGGRLVHRADDSADVVLQRFRVYQDKSRPLVDFYQSRSTFLVVNGAQPVDRVEAALVAAIDGAWEATAREASR